MWIPIWVRGYGGYDGYGGGSGSGGYGDHKCLELKGFGEEKIGE